ncbi:MAG: glycoside hydrolase family 2 TIM barrel-domain containing protein [Bacteroidia bacterium]|nr:glycoside hydrolase family 2 TIM barrel-domain containing protein [Bacteroidia bacterium]
MKKLSLLTVLVLLAPVYAGAQDKPYLQDLPYYVENLAVYGEGQEDGRAFHIPASSVSLNGTWKFMFCESPYDVPQDFFNTSFNDRKWSSIEVPSNWEMQGFGQALFRNVSAPWPTNTPQAARDAQMRARGGQARPAANRPVPQVAVNPNAKTPPEVPMDVNPTGAYRTSFNIPSAWKGDQIFLRFEKVASASFVWVNGRQVGYNEGAQEPSEYNITEYVKPGRNSLAVLVLKYSDGYYLEGQDYWRLAGIFDDVTVYASPDLRIWDYQVITDFDGSFKDSDVSLAVELRAYTAEVSGCSLTAEISKDGRTVATMSKEGLSIAAGGKNTVNLRTKVVAPLKWTAETPELYTLTMTLKDAAGRTVDTMVKKMGFKKTEIKDGVFYLNGQPIKVNAQCSHMQHPVLGHAMDEATVRKDMEILKQFGFNAVRTSHYPPVNEYLDLADEYGLYIIDETGDEAHATEWVSYLPEYIPMYQERVRQMVLRDRNHACVLFWSAGNESGEGPNISEVVKEGRKYDPTRFWMYGGNAAKHAAEDIVGPRYPIPIEHELSYGVDTSDPRPSFMDEYISVAGNGGGGFDDFWREIYAHPSLLGGAVWDFVSPGLLEPVRTLEDKSPYSTKANIMGKAKLVKGRTGLAIDLDKTDQWVEVYRGNNLEISGDKLTLTLDIYPRKYNKSGGYMITKGSNQFGLRQMGADKIQFYIDIDNGSKNTLTGDLPSDWEGKWHNVTAVYDSENMTIYIDSKPVASQPLTGSIRNLPLGVCIGRDEEKNGQDTNEYIADALIDNVGIFADAVTPDKGFDPAKSALWLDFEKETNEGTFYTWGLGARTYGSIWPDRTVQPEMYQMKKSTQPFSYNLLDPRTGSIEITNHLAFTNASVYNTTWTITADDKVVASGTLNLDVDPLQTKAYRIPYTKPSIEAGKEYRLNISTVLAKDEIWAAKGHEVAWEQFELSDWNVPAAVAAKPSGSVTMEKTDGRYIARGAGFAYTFDALSGELCGMQVDGQEMLTEPLKLNVWRAPLANELDGWNNLPSRGAIANNKTGFGAIGHSTTVATIYYSASLDKVGFLPLSVNAREVDGSVYVDVRELALFGTAIERQLDAYIVGRTNAGIESVYSYRIDADGTITVKHLVNPQGDMPAWLPRIGVTMSLNGTLGNVEWYGRGPQASYPDRKTGYRLGIYKDTVEDMYEPYLVPQDYGLRMDNRWVRFTDGSGKGLQFSMNEPFAFNAYPFTNENLTRSMYQYQLQKSGGITLNLDYATSGVGCTARSIFDAYRAYPTGYTRTITIKLIR